MAVASPPGAGRAQESERIASLLDFARARAAGAVEGLFGPASMTWLVEREAVLVGGAAAALLMQIAHPAVAAAVEHHSRYRDDAAGRARRTFGTMYQITFGDLDTALDLARRLSRRHSVVQGEIEPGGAAYRASDLDLIKWVHATWLHTHVRLFEAAVRPLSAEERRRLYEESITTAAVYGLPREQQPPDWHAFERYFETMVESPALCVGPVARAQYDALVKNPPSSLTSGVLMLGQSHVTSSIADLRPVRVLLSRIGHTLTSGLLPPRLREGFGCAWGRAREGELRALLATTRQSVRLLPAALRYHPAYHAAMARIASHAEGRPVAPRGFRIDVRDPSFQPSAPREDG